MMNKLQNVFLYICMFSRCYLILKRRLLGNLHFLILIKKSEKTLYFKFVSRALLRWLKWSERQSIFKLKPFTWNSAGDYKQGCFWLARKVGTVPATQWQKWKPFKILINPWKSLKSKYKNNIKFIWMVEWQNE